LRRLANTVARHLGLEVIRATPDAGTYTRNYPYTFPTYAPWFEPAFQRVYAPVRGRTLVTEDRCYTLLRLGRYAASLQADFAECGVYRGGTAYLLAAMLRETGHPDTPLHLFDTFSGMPDTAVPKRDWHKPGDLADTSAKEVGEFLSSYANVTLHPGFIPRTFEQVRDRRFAFAHVDVDLYPSTYDCCAFFYERLVPGGILVCDDYGFAHFERAAKKAVDTFFAGKPEAPLALHTGQCVVVKLPD
jgi:O-methyltransferase